MVKDDIQLHNQLEFMNFKLKFESSIVKKKKSYLLHLGFMERLQGTKGPGTKLRLCAVPCVCTFFYEAGS